MLLIVCFLFCGSFHFFRITMTVWNNTLRSVTYTSILWSNILVIAPNCNILFFMFSSPDRCQAGFSASKSQSCILVSKKYLREPSLSQLGPFSSKHLRSVSIDSFCCLQALCPSSLCCCTYTFPVGITSPLTTCSSAPFFFA